MPMLINAETDIPNDQDIADEYRILLSDLQGNILQPHARHYAIHLFLSFNSNPGTLSYVRSWIRGLASRRITTAWQEESHGRHGAFCTLLLTSKGYKLLGEPIPENTAFQMGMKARGEQLSDPPIKQWEPGFQKDIHALLILANHDPLVLAQDSVREKVAAWSMGVTIVAEEPGYRLLREGYDIEHFGYRDGISQLKWITRLQGTTSPAEFLTSARIVLAEEQNLPGHFGSYMVFRKLEQNVFTWEQNIVHLAAQLQADREIVAAFALGRFRDGTPVIAYDQMQPASATMNDFYYTSDFDDNRCPLHAHIRKTNPREEREYSVSEEYPQIARRGMVYGMRPDLHPKGRMFPLPETGVGLLFLCYQSDIERQFEYIQRAANSNDQPRYGSGPDPVIAQGEYRDLPNQWPVRHGSSERIPFAFNSAVTLKGGEYFFAPSITFFRNL